MIPALEQSALPIGVAFVQATIRTATPLALAASGELVVERTGMINIGLEGTILTGAFASLVGATHGGIATGFMAAAAGGMLVALVFALVTLWARGDQIISGMALTLLALGATGTLYRTVYGATGAALSIPTSGPMAIPILSRFPLVGPALFAQPPVTYVTCVAVLMLWWWLSRTHAGVALRAIGESPDAAEAAGIPVRRYRLGAALFGGVMGGLAGGALVLSQAGTFAEGMSAGRGFIAIAIVVLGRWSALGVAGAALLFGSTTALQYLAQAIGLDVPYQLFLALPYVLTLAALAGIGGRASAPAMLARIE